MSENVATTVPYHIGTSGWIYEHWRGRFYPPELPQSHWFGHYAHHFDTVEINNTFYHLPEAHAVEGWRRQAPAGFEYAVKANRYLTHLKKLRDAAAPLERFFAVIRLLGEHGGPILYQLPPHWKANLARLQAFLERLPQGWVHVFEFRDPSWLQEPCYQLLERAAACLCIHDLIPRHPKVLTGPAVYVRFHGAGQLYGGRYSRAALDRWARWMRQVAGQDRRVYAYFNNDANAYAVFNAKTLRGLLTEPRAEGSTGLRGGF